MEQGIRQVADLLAQGITAIINFLQMIWTWSFGQIITIFQTDFQSLPMWKLIVLAIAIIAMAYFLYKAGKEIWASVVALFSAFIKLLTSFVQALPWVLIAGLIAFAASWAITSLNFG